MEEEVYASALTDFFHKKPIDYAKKTKVFNEEELF
jgi:ribonucleoside-diphosphate reductase beta chain